MIYFTCIRSLFIMHQEWYNDFISKSLGGVFMDSMESKKLALIRIWQILRQYSDCDHPLTQGKIS